MTAIKFICLLLHHNPRIVERIGLLEGYQPSTGPRKVLLPSVSTSSGASTATSSLRCSSDVPAS
jgi:hypothetical protein